MPYGIPFSDLERGRLDRLSASGDRIADCMLRCDVDFPGAIEVLGGLRPAAGVVDLAAVRATREGA